jgi:tetratricopeptide (TPR) repeat protein
MIIRHLRALAAALLLGGAVTAVATLAAPQAAQAATVRPAVGKPLQEAIQLAGSGNGGAAMAKVREAESVGGLTASEQQAIAQTKEYVAAKTGAGGSATGCKAKFANDYNGGRYRDAIADADCLRKSGGMSGEDQLIVAQAYYLSGDYAEAIRELKNLGDSPQVLELMLSAAYKSGDSASMRDVLEELVEKGKTQYWANLLTSAENTKGLQDHQTLDIYRLRFLTGSMRNADDYMLAAELALQIGSPQEAVNIAQKGMDTKAISGDRAVRLLNLAKSQAAKDSASFGAMQKAADSANGGDADVKLGEEYWGFGRYSDAISTIQNGIKKGVTDKANAQIRLGLAYMGAGQRDAAVRAFNTVTKDDGNQQVIAHLWSIYARTSK